MRCAVRPHAALPPVLGLLLQHFQEGLQGVAVPGGGEFGTPTAPPWWAAGIGGVSSPIRTLMALALHHQATPASRES